jgi:DNA mismatch endonuclease (patch repair protein)
MFWQQKFAGTVDRDKQSATALANLGWRVITAWECEIRQDGVAAAAKIAREITTSPAP